MDGSLQTRALRLIAATARRQFDVDVDIDWSVPCDDEKYYYLPPEKLVLYGTPQWAAFDEQERRAYSRHEWAAYAAVGIFFENVAMQTILKYLTTMPQAGPVHEYLLLEVAEECKHSIMFGRCIDWAGSLSYAPPVGTGSFHLGEEYPEFVIGFLLLLAVEELTDASNRATMSSELVHPVARDVARCHVLEEARHISFARAYLKDVWPTLSSAQQLLTREFTLPGVEFISSLLINDKVFAALGIHDGGQAARSNPHHVRRLVKDLEPVSSFLLELGLIQDTDRSSWEARGLLAS